MKAIGFAIAVALLGSPLAASAKEREAIKVSGPKNAAGLTDLVIGSFSVAFIRQKTDAAFAGSKNQFKAMGSIVKSTLSGVGAPEFQAITDAAYADFVARLGAAGFKLQDRAGLVADKAMAKVRYVPSGAEGTLQFGKDAKAKAVFFAPGAFGSNAIMDGEISAGAPQGLGGIMGSFAAMAPLQGKVMFAVTNKQPVINVVYVIDYADAERYGGTYAIQASVTTRASLAVVETLSKVDTYNAKGATTSLVLAAPIGVGGDFGDLADTTTAGQKVDNVLGSLIGGLAGVGTNTYKSLTFTADPAQYRTGAIDAVQQANARFVERLVAIR